MSLYSKYVLFHVREAAKKVIYFSIPAPKPPPPSSLVATFFWGNFSFELQKKIFFLSGQPPPPLLVAGPLKRTYFAASLRHINIKNNITIDISYNYIKILLGWNNEEENQVTRLRVACLDFWAGLGLILELVLSVPIVTTNLYCVW